MLRMPASVKDRVAAAAVNDTLGLIVIASTAITKDNTTAYVFATCYLYYGYYTYIT